MKDLGKRTARYTCLACKASDVLTFTTPQLHRLILEGGKCAKCGHQGSMAVERVDDAVPVGRTVQPGG